METIELRDFIAETVKQIFGAIDDIGEGVEWEKGGIPERFYAGRGGGAEILSSLPGDRPVRLVDFDVAVSATKRSGSKAGIGVVIPFFGGGVDADSEKVGSTLSRIKFSLPIQLGRSEAEIKLRAGEKPPPKRPFVPRRDSTPL